MANLRKFNFVMGIFHLIQGVLMLALSNDFKVPLTTSYLTFDASTRSAVTLTEEIAHIQVGPLVALFLFLSALFHFIVSSPVAYDWYAANIKKGMNPARWYEYSISASVMIVVIAMLSGVYDLWSLVLMFTLNAAMIWFGHMMELYNQGKKKTDWTAYIYGCVAGAVPWVVIFAYFYSAIADVDAAPDFLYGIIISLFIFFNIFAVNMYLQYKQVGPWKDYMFGEKMYIVLSLLAKSALAWQVFSGTLR